MVSRIVAPEKWADQQAETMLGPDGLVSFRQQNRRVATANAHLDSIGRRQAIELPGVRKGEWVYRATTYAVDPWDVLAYVGNRTGDEAVRASDEFLQILADACTQGRQVAIDGA